MLVFIYEFITGGGWYQLDVEHSPAGSLCEEGSAMLRSLARDFAQLPDIKVICLCDTRLEPIAIPGVASAVVSSAASERDEFFRCASSADWTVVIAPEFQGYLAERAGWVELAAGRLLSPDSRFVSLASDKHATCERLRASGIRTPRGCTWRGGDASPDGLPLPWVIKPCDGAGSMDVRLISNHEQLERFSDSSRRWRVEEFCPGSPASVSIVCGPAGNVALPASRQNLSDDGRFRYLGGVTPLSAELCHRASRLAHATVAALPATTGYIGIDLVLEDSADGSGDTVIEVNPRLTSSYLGLRKLARGNLAAAMLQVAQGELVELSFGATPVEFIPANE
jgi:predicted ATP-grasp superfamily ATP-dependent carboligase